MSINTNPWIPSKIQKRRSSRSEKFKEIIFNMALKQLDVYEALDFTVQLYVKNQLEYEISARRFNVKLKYGRCTI